MRASQGPLRRAIALSLVLCLALVLILWGSNRQRTSPIANSILTVPVQHDDIGQVSLKGHAIAPKLGNETAKAELGRAAWKLLHTVMARFPDEPNADEKSALKSYIHLFQRLYPCGECAEHFGAILEKFPPQVSSRSAAAAWACHVHNEVNKSLNKPIFDCAKIGDFYDCGCADDKQEGVTEARTIPLDGQSDAAATTNDSTQEADPRQRMIHKHHPKDS